MLLALDLVNTQGWYGRGPAALVDGLAKPGGIGRFAERWGLTAAGEPDARERDELLRLRNLLRRMTTPLADGDEPAAEDVEELNQYLAAVPFQRRLVREDDGYRTILLPAGASWRWALSEIAASFAELLASAERERVKVCANPDCLWAFYDETRNRSRRWCDPAECGNVFKQRRFRARRRGDTAA